jgi:hypothetical protein
MRVSSGLLLSVAVVCIFVALTCQNVTVAGNYDGVLLVALACVAMADVCCAIIFLRGDGLRWVSVIVAMPTMFVLWDLARRASINF